MYIYIYIYMCVYIYIYHLVSVNCEHELPGRPVFISHRGRRVSNEYLSQTNARTVDLM
jgi:hypothetical protein